MKAPLSLLLALSLAAAPLALTACGGGSSDDAPAAETETDTTTENNETEAPDAATDDQETEATNTATATDGAKPETVEEAGYLDSYGNLTLCAIDELGAMRPDYDFDFIDDVLFRGRQGYVYDDAEDIWWHSHGWFTVYDKNGEKLPSDAFYSLLSVNAEAGNEEEPFLATIAVSKEDYPDAKAAYEAIAKDPMGGEERSEFSSDGSWDKGVVWGNKTADVYVVLVGDGGDVWRVNILPNKALGQGLLAKVAGLPYLTYTEAYTEVPEGTVF